MYPFAYHRPDSIEEAIRLHGACEDAAYLAGAQTLLPTLRQRLAAPSDVIDLQDLPGLAGIEVGEAVVAVGALTPHAVVAASPEVRAQLPALAALAGGVGDPQVRNRGTLGGSIANNDPAADYPAAVLGLGATIDTDRREIPAEEFFVDLFTTALEPDELITRVRFPRPARAAYLKFPQPASRFALVGVMVADAAQGPRVAVTGAGPCAFRLAAFERALAADFRPEALDDVGCDADGLNEDLHASAAYRAHLIGVLARRAVAALV